MGKERLSRDQREARYTRAWTSRYAEPMVAPVKPTAREFNFSPAQVAVDQAHSVDKTRWGDPVTFMEAQVTTMGVEVPQFPKVSGVAFDARVNATNGVDRPNM